MSKIKFLLGVAIICSVFAADLFGQSRLTGDKYTISVGNFPDSFGVTYDPVVVPDAPFFFDFESLENDGDDWGGDPVELTFDGIEETAGRLKVNERVHIWGGATEPILVEQASGIDGETEFELIEWEAPGEIVEFSFQTADDGFVADKPGDQSFYSLIGLDWANSDAGSEPFFFETGFFFYFSEQGKPMTGYETQLPEIGLLVGPHPFDESIPEVVYIGYSRGQVNETTKAYEGGVHVTGGTTQLDENDGSWAALIGAMGVDPGTQTGIHLGFLVEPPTGPDIVFVNGDTNLDQVIDVKDINTLTQAICDGLTDAHFDLNDDSAVDAADRTFWVEKIMNTYFGDANLDGEFNSGDFVTVFQAGEYEDGVAGNSNWGTGDWNGDKEFDTGDFVTAFQAGGFEIGPRMDAVASVPEPACLSFMAVLGILAFLKRK